MPWSRRHRREAGGTAKGAVGRARGITMIVHRNFLEAYTVNSAGRRSSDMKGGKAFFTLYFIVMSEFFHNKPILSL